MRRCYRGIALAVGGILMASPVSTGSCSIGSLTVYAAEDAPSEEMQDAFQEEVQTGDENVETEIPTEEAQAVPTTAQTEMSMEEQEYQVLLKIVEAEAGGEDATGKLLVANVVMNRVRSPQFPNTITEVVYQRHQGKAQFSPIADGRIDRVQVSAETAEAVSRAISGEDLSQGALYFRSTASKSGWFDRALRRVLEYGNHIFYIP